MLVNVFLVAVCLLQLTYITLLADGAVPAYGVNGFNMELTSEMMKNMTRSAIINSKRFVLVTAMPDNWFMAGQICKFNGMNFAVINGIKEHNIIGKLIDDTGYNGHAFWTSGNDLGIKHSWYWESNGSPVNYTNWAPGQPDDSKAYGTEERCLSLPAKIHQWNDAPCEFLYYYICEEVAKVNATVN